jgi:hypothetical protein
MGIRNIRYENSYVNRAVTVIKNGHNFREFRIKNV